MANSIIKKWDTISLSKPENLKIFELVKVKRRHPDIKKESEFIVLDSPKWVNIIPITANNEVIFVEQYRHGIDEITLEIPGGLVEQNEDPRYAAERECAEETGYSGKSQAELLGENFPNPAFLNNVCYSYVWRDCSLTSAQKLDGNEDINVRLIPLAEIKNNILDGSIRHSLVLTAFFYYDLKFGL